MSRQKRGSLGLRKIIAKIQKDFDFPRITAVRCKIATSVNTHEDPVPTSLMEIPVLQTDVHALQVDFEMPLQQGAFGDIACFTEAPMESLETEVSSETCWDSDPIPIHANDVRFQAPHCHGNIPEITTKRVTTFPTRIRVPLVKRPPMMRMPRVNGGRDLAARLPLRLKVQLMSQVSKKIVIRCRAVVLKQLQLKPTQVKFIGLVNHLPPVPLSILRYEPSSDKGAVIHAEVKGPARSYLQHRAWILVQIEGRDDLLPITVKEDT